MPCLLIALTLVAGCSDSSETPSAGATVLNYGVTSPPQSMDPAKGYIYGMAFLTQESLIRLEPDGSYSPGLAESFQYVGDENRVFEVKLRSGLKFSDGEPLTAEAVKTWLEYMAETPGPSQTKIAIDSVEVVDDLTVRINLAAPNPLMPFWLGSVNTGWGSVVSPRAIEENTLGEDSAGAGQYKVDPADSVAGDHYTLVPNEHYYDKSKVEFSKVVVRVIANPSSMLQAIQAGQIQVAQGDPSTAEAAESAGLTVAHAPTFNNAIFFLDLSGEVSKPLADPRVRKALNYAVDREKINDAINGDYGEATQVFATTDAQAEENPYPYDPEEARKLLAEAGYADGFELPILCYSARATTCQAVAQDLKNVGVDLKITTPATDAEWGQKYSSGTFPAALVLYPIWPAYNAVSDRIAKNAPANQHGFVDETIERLLGESMSADEEISSKLANEMIARTVSEAYFVPLYASSQFYYATDSIGGVELTGPLDWFLPLPTYWHPN